MEQIMEMLTFSPFYYSVGISVLLLLIVVLFILVVNSKKKLKALSRKYDSFMRGKDAETLEDTILSRFKQVDELWDFSRKNEKEITAVKENLRHAYQKVGLVKYDAYNEMGGKLSFVVVLLDKENNGYMINAMHNREGCYTYMKEIIAGESQVVLSEEESEALDKAIYG